MQQQPGCCPNNLLRGLLGDSKCAYLTRSGVEVFLTGCAAKDTGCSTRLSSLKRLTSVSMNSLNTHTHPQLIAHIQMRSSTSTPSTKVRTSKTNSRDIASPFQMPRTSTVVRVQRQCLRECNKLQAARCITATMQGLSRQISAGTACRRYQTSIEVKFCL